jgi:hypothetical protein
MKHLSTFHLFEAERRHQTFEYAGIEFDIDKAMDIIEAEPREPMAIDPKKWAPKWLAIHHDEQGNEIWDTEVMKKLKKLSFHWGVGFNLDHLKDLNMEEPGILAMVGDIPILIDGNHRLARNYHEGKKEMPVYVLTSKETEKVITNMSPQEIHQFSKKAKSYSEVDEMAEITRKGTRVLAGDKPLKGMKATELEGNMVLFYDKAGRGGLFPMPPGKFWLYLMDSDDAAKKMGAGEYDMMLFPFRRAYSFTAAPITDVWKKSHTKNFKGSEHILAITEGVATDDKILLEMMSVRPGYKHNKIQTLMVDYIKNFMPKAKLVFEDPTEDGLNFMWHYAPDAEVKWTIDYRPKIWKEKMKGKENLHESNNTTQVKITWSNMDPKALETFLKKVCLLRTAKKIGDTETINNTQKGRLDDNKGIIKYEIVNGK